MIGLINILLFSVAIANLILGSLLIFKKRSKSNIFFGIAVYGVALWNLSMVLFRITNDPNNLMIWCKMLYIAATITASGFLYFSYVFPLNKFTIMPAKRLVLLLPPIAMLAIIALPNTFIKNISIFSNYYRTVEFDKTYILYAFFIASYFILAFYKLIKAYKNNTGISKFQLLYVLLGSAISTIIGVIADLLMPWLGYFQAYWVGPVFTLIMVLFITYAIIRYRLMDIRIAIRKSSFYILVAGFVYIFFYITIWLMNKLFGSVYSPRALILGCFLAFVFVALFILIERLGRKVISKHLFGNLYSQHKTLTNLTQKLTTIIDLNQLTSLIIVTLLKTLKIKKTAILLRKAQNKHYQIQGIAGFEETNIRLLMQNSFLIKYLEKLKKPIIYEELKDLTVKDKKEQLISLKSAMQKTKAVVFMPLIIKNNLEGIIILGKKASDSAYTKEDLRLLEALANQTSIAIENAKLFNQVQDLGNKLKDMNQNLEQKVSDQTKNIREQAENIKALLRMKSDLLNTISHQLRTPTSIFRGMLAMINEKGQLDSNEREEFIEKSFAAADRLVVIINSINEANKLQGEKISLDLNPVLIQDIIKESMNIFLRTAKEKNIKLEFKEPEQKIPKIFLDQEWIKSAIEKLIDNAIWYTKENGKVLISVSHNEQDETVSVKIKDNGIGLTDDDKKILFTQFGKGRGSKMMNVNSSGLGLFIVKKIAEAHKGKIEVFSQGENKGSYFALTLPIMQVV